MIDLLLEAQKVKGMGDVNDQNKEGRTALHWAALESNEITAEHLIEKGADLHCQANHGGTPLHYAAAGAKDMEIIDVLLKNIRDGEIDQYKEDVTLLAYACNNEHGLGGEIIEQLVEKGIFNNEDAQNSQVLEALNAIKPKVAQDRHSKSSNEDGLGGAMANPMEEKGDVEAGTVRDKQPNRYKQSKVKVGSIDHIVGDNSQWKIKSVLYLQWL
jgi:ankyrin repeat protein